MNSRLEAALTAKLGASIRRSRSVGGGCINDAYRIELDDDRVLFVKSHDSAPARMYELEAHGLGVLREADALRIPEVVAVSAPTADVDFLVLEHIEAGRPSRSYDEELGRGLARLHRAHASCFGLDRNNYLATLEQDNESEESWATFYCERRLRPQLELATARGLARHNWQDDFEQLFAKMPELVGDPEPPARLHGDLWSGNVYCDEAGQPVLIDPAVYGGHREVDLAMLQLFGSPSQRVFDAYDECYERTPGHRQRVALYQLYPLLAHVNLFGTSYQGQVESCLQRYL